MSVTNALAGVAAKDLAASAKWYARLIGETGNQPMKEVYEWSLPAGGVLQVFEDADRAGSSSVTLSVTDLDHHVATLAEQGIQASSRTSSDVVSTAIIRDPDGNQVVLAEQHSGKIAR